jgi:23S rRNA (uracil1939-C5)-methyltransferase
MSKAALKSLVDLNVPTLAYVSCDPATLARDLKALMAAHYRLIQVMPFDFFPHTSHLETLVFLQKR